MQQTIAPPHPWRSMRDSGRASSGLEQRSIQYPIPRRGEQKLLVLLVDFPDPDRRGQFSGQAWQHFFFGSGGFSDYYQEVSYGQLRYTGDVVGMSGSSYIINDSRVTYTRLPHSVSYYANNEAGQGDNFPHNTSGVVWDAAQALDDAGFDFAPYANSHTRFIENLMVVFAGPSAREEHTSYADTLMPTAYSLREPYITRNGQSIRDFTFCPERHGSKIITSGVSIHEHGHALGMCDLYDQSLRTVGVGRYDVMGYGIEPDGFTHPVHFGIFSKTFLGWVQFSSDLQQDADVILPPAEAISPAHGSQSGRFVKLYPNGNLSSPEYFLIENRQPLGFDSDWVQLGLSPGILIWHVDETIARDSDYQYCNVINTPFSTRNDNCFTRRNKSVPSHYGVTVIEADGYNNMVSEQKKDYGTSADTWVAGMTWRGMLRNGQDSGLSVSVLRQHREPDNQSVDLRIEGWFRIAT